MSHISLQNKKKPILHISAVQYKLTISSYTKNAVCREKLTFSANSTTTILL